ncbi:stage II sporulation protein P [[Clostridium] polysaccharolyticum]|uniref:Stage II sporulation protein P n=1 Tax=[Clostridium] polysaccharolyticum TaxID=29364 RepID=A0A1H9ZQ40_9FIRM|nr:stage II sporulation protein P [[Clostridium] polysaccharolyticum]SES83695.1 stage II sporulation protein P [[Clostridium] polysaccharolyticum]
METGTVYRHRGKKRISKMLFAVLGLTITAILVSFMGNKEQLKDTRKIWNHTMGTFCTTLSLQHIQNYAPGLEYGLYQATGKRSFVSWELGFLQHNLGKKKATLLDLVEELSIEAEKENVKEASILDHTIIVDRALEENNESTEVGSIYGESYFEQSRKQALYSQELAMNQKKLEQLKSTKSLQFLINNFYIVDSSTSIDQKVFQVENLLKTDCTMKTDSEKPQILIYHTHASEEFIDSDGTKKDSVVGAGTALAKYLTEEYGYNVIHDETSYDVVNGRLNRNKAYDKARKGITKILKKYPSIEVVIDLHRDASNDGSKKTTIIDGKPTAVFKFFNGLSRRATGADRADIPNPRLQKNLAFSLKMKMKAMELYPTLTTKNYLKSFRYNMHLRDKSLLIEMGTEKNTVEEAKNAMKPLADVLNEVLNE